MATMDSEQPTPVEDGTAGTSEDDESGDVYEAHLPPLSFPWVITDPDSGVEYTFKDISWPEYREMYSEHLCVRAGAMDKWIDKNLGRILKMFGVDADQSKWSSATGAWMTGKAWMAFQSERMTLADAEKYRARYRAKLMRENLEDSLQDAMDEATVKNTEARSTPGETG